MKKSFILAGIAIMMLSSCATIISGSKQNVKFTSTPNEAVVFIDGSKIGKTPIETKLKRDKNYKVSIQLEGYQPHEMELKKEFNAWYLGNILFGGIIGLVIDPITGAIYKLSPNEVNAQLQQGTAFKSNKNDIFIAVSLKKDENWHKVGQLEKL